MLEATEKTKLFLSSASALQSIERDPYWPKWDSPADREVERGQRGARKLRQRTSKLTASTDWPEAALSST